MEILQTPNEFLIDLLDAIEKAKTSVFLQTMILESGKVESLLEDACIKAIVRGVDVRIHYDWISQEYVHGDLHKQFKNREYERNLHRENTITYKRLEKLGIKMSKANVPRIPFRLIPFAGRDHRKLYIVDNATAWVGGINLFDKSFENIDFMVKTNNTKLVTALTDAFLKVQVKKERKDEQIPIDTEFAIFMDSGRIGKSIIYARALDLIEKAQKNIIFMSQYIPDGVLLQKLIKKSSQGVHVAIVTSEKNSQVFTKYPEKLSYLYLTHAIKNYPNISLIHLSRYVHAKLLLIDQQEALFGSHNLTFSGVVLGTEEIMIDTTNTILLSQIDQFVQSSVSANSV